MQIAPGPLARRTQALRMSQNDSRLEKTSGSTWGGALAALRGEGHSQQPRLLQHQQEVNYLMCKETPFSWFWLLRSLDPGESQFFGSVGVFLPRWPLEWC